MNEETLIGIDERLRILEHENAERKPVSELIKLLMYFLIGISVVLGLFGLKQFSDIGTIIQEEVARQYPKGQQKYLDYKTLIDDTLELYKNFEKISGKYSVALSNFSNLDKVTADFDIEGKIGQVISDSTDRYRADQESGKWEKIYEEPWRSNAISLLELLSSLQEKKNFDSDFIFNAAQSADQLQLDELAYRLMKAANKKRPNSAAIKAGMLSGAIDIGSEEEIDQAYGQLMDMVRNLTLDSPNIVLSEAWNATEDERQYPALIEAIDDLIKKGEFIPSYAYAIQAEAILRESKQGSLDRARAVLELAKNKMSEETAHSVWAESSMRQIIKVRKAINKTVTVHALLDNNLTNL